MILTESSIYKQLLFTFVCLVVINSCTSMTESFDEFADEKETVYLGKPTVLVTSGFEQVRFQVILNADPRITGGKLQTLDGAIAHDFEVIRQNSGADTTNVDLDLAEGEYRFEVVLMDDNGNESIGIEVPAQVLGEDYVAKLAARQVESIHFDKGDGNVEPAAVINLDKTFENLLEVRIHYLNSKGEEEVAVANSTANTIRIADFQSDATFTMESVYGPENPFGEFVSSATVIGTFPPCNARAEITSSVASLDLGAVESRQANVESFTIQSSQCINGAVSVSVSGDYFGIGTSVDGPFGSSLEFVDVSSPVEIFVEFAPNGKADNIFTGNISVNGTNILQSTMVDLTGEEMGVLGGLALIEDITTVTEASSMFTDDNEAYHWGGNVAKLLGEDGWGVHGADNVPIPWGYYTLDLGADYDIVEISFRARNDCCQDRTPKKYEYWGLPDGTDPASAIPATVLTSNPDNLNTWRKESLEKGWVSLGKFEVDDLSEATGGNRVVDEINSALKVRYLRVVILESFQDGVVTMNYGGMDIVVNLDTE